MPNALWTLSSTKGLTEKMYLFLKQSVNPDFLYAKFQTNNIKSHINYSNGIIRFFQIPIVHSSDQHYNIINTQQINSIANGFDTYPGNLLILLLHFCQKDHKQRKPDKQLDRSFRKQQVTIIYHAKHKHEQRYENGQ